jgi:hypothetical protein
MTPTSDHIISNLGKKAADFFRSYRIAGLKAVLAAAKEHDDVIDVYATQSAEYVAGSWDSKFGRHEARQASYQLAALVAAVGILALNSWGMWLAYTHFGFDSLGMGVATVASIIGLGVFSLVFAALIAAEGKRVSCEFCLAVSLWTRGWTPVSMEWFGSDSGATWGLGARNVYIWQKPFHGWGNPELRVVRYQDIATMGHPERFTNFLAFSLDFSLPTQTEWLRFPESSNGMNSTQLGFEIAKRAASFGREVDMHVPKSIDPVEEGENVLTLYPPIRPPESCWKLLF